MLKQIRTEKFLNYNPNNTDEVNQVEGCIETWVNQGWVIVERWPQYANGIGLFVVLEREHPDPQNEEALLNHIRVAQDEDEDTQYTLQDELERRLLEQRDSGLSLVQYWTKTELSETASILLLRQAISPDDSERSTLDFFVKNIRFLLSVVYLPGYYVCKLDFLIDDYLDQVSERFRYGQRADVTQWLLGSIGKILEEV